LHLTAIFMGESVFDHLNDLVLNHLSVLVEVVSLDPSEHEKVKDDHGANVHVPRLDSLFRGVDQAFRLVANDLLGTVVVVVLVGVVFADELPLFLLKSSVSLGGEVNLLVGVEAGEEQDAEEVQGLGGRGSVFPLFDLELLLSSVSHYLFRHLAVGGVSVTVCACNCLGLHVVSGQVEVDFWRTFNALINVLEHSI